MSINDIEDRGSVVIVTIPKTKTNKKRIFTIVDDDVVSALVLYKKYVALYGQKMYIILVFSYSIGIKPVLFSL